jgi:hypothetical protein
MTAMSSGEKFFLGYYGDLKAQLFISKPEDATLAQTGYDRIEGPFDTQEDARAFDPEVGRGGTAIAK